RSDIPVPQGTAVFGELSLAGELRSVPKIRQRAKTAEGLGFFNLYAADTENGITEIKDIRSLVKNVLK
ncbi:MAG: DNA repair protein RadA, partial [Treponema sp.]